MEDLLFLCDDYLQANQFIVTLDELEKADEINYLMRMTAYGQYAPF